MSPPPRPAPFSTHTRRGAVADRNSGQGTHSRADAGSEPRSIITTSTCTSGHPSPEARLGNRALDHRGTRTERNNFLEVLVMMDCPHLASVIRERELRVRPLPWIELLATAEHHAVPVLARPLSPLTRRRWSRRRHPWVEGSSPHRDSDIRTKRSEVVADHHQRVHARQPCRRRTHDQRSRQRTNCRSGTASWAQPDGFVCGWHRPVRAPE